MLIKDPTRRFTIKQIKRHPWVTDGGKNPMPELEGCVEVGEMEKKDAFTGLKERSKVNIKF